MKPRSTDARTVLGRLQRGEALAVIAQAVDDPRPVVGASTRDPVTPQGAPQQPSRTGAVPEEALFPQMNTRATRDRAGRTVAETARHLGLTEGCCWNHPGHHARFTDDELARLSAWLGVPVEDLTGVTGDWPHPIPPASRGPFPEAGRDARCQAPR